MKKYYLISVLVLSAFILPNCGDPAGGNDESDLGSLTGTVVDEETGDPLSEVQITLTPVEGFQPANVPSPVSTDGQGKYTMSNIYGGGYTLRATKGEYVAESQSVTVASGGTTTANVQMSRISSELVLATPSNGQLNLGTASTGEFTVSNTGGSAATLVTTNNKEWITVTPTDVSIPAGEQRTFQVFIDRTDSELAVVDTYTDGRISLENSTEGTSLTTVQLTIEVAKPSFSLNNTSLRFENDQTTKDLIITNGNQATIKPTLESLNNIAGISAAFTGDYNEAVGLAPGDNATFRITADRKLIPSTINNQRVQITATADGPDPDPVEIGITVIIERPKIQLSASSLSFSPNPDSTEKVIVVTNTGNARLDWETVDFSYAESTNWISVNSVSPSIAPGASAELVVKIDRSAFIARDTYNALFSISAQGEPLVQDQQISVSAIHEPKLVRLIRTDDNAITSGSGQAFTVDLELRGTEYYVGDFTIGFSAGRLELISVERLDGAITGYGTALTPAMDNETRNAVISANSNGSFTVSAGMVKNIAGLSDNAQFPTDGTGRNLLRLTFEPKSLPGTTNIDLRDVKIYLFDDLNNAQNDVAKIELLPIVIN